MKISDFAFISMVGVMGCTSPMNSVANPDKTLGSPTNKLVVTANTLYFFGSPPEKVRMAEFKDKQALAEHFDGLASALKQRNPVKDANYAFAHGMKIFLGNHAGIIQGGRGNPLRIGNTEVEQRCPGSANYKVLEGYQLLLDVLKTNDTLCLSSSGCKTFSETLDNSYGVSWNREMSRLCQGGVAR